MDTVFKYKEQFSENKKNFRKIRNFQEKTDNYDAF